LPPPFALLALALMELELFLDWIVAPCPTMMMDAMMM
jgi:hypothetical protein